MMKLRFSSPCTDRLQRFGVAMAFVASVTLMGGERADAASLRSIQGAGAVLAVAVSPDSKTVASGGFEGTVTLWDSATLAATKTLPVQEADNIGGGGEAPQGDPNQEEPAVGGLIPGVPMQGNPGEMPVPGQEAPGQEGMGNFQNYVMSLAFSPNGKVLAVGYNDGSITFWNQENGNVTNTGSVHRGSVHAVAFSADGKWMASGANSTGDDLVKLWNMENGQVTWSVPNLNSRVLALAFSPDSTLLACACSDGVVAMADVTAQQAAALSGPAAGGGNYTWSLAFAPDGATLAGVTYDNEIKFWNAQSKQVKQTWKGSAQPDDGITSIAYAPDGKLFAICNGHNARGAVELRNVDTGEINEVLSPETLHGKAEFAPNGKFLVIGSRDSIDTTLSIWDME